MSSREARCSLTPLGPFWGMACATALASARTRLTGQLWVPGFHLTGSVVACKEFLTGAIVVGRELGR